MEQLANLRVSLQKSENEMHRTAKVRSDKMMPGAWVSRLASEVDSASVVKEMFRPYWECDLLAESEKDCLGRSKPNLPKKILKSPKF